MACTGPRAEDGECMQEGVHPQQLVNSLHHAHQQLNPTSGVQHDGRLLLYNQQQQQQERPEAQQRRKPHPSPSTDETDELTTALRTYSSCSPLVSSEHGPSDPGLRSRAGLSEADPVACASDQSVIHQNAEDQALVQCTHMQTQQKLPTEHQQAPLQVFDQARLPSEHQQQQQQQRGEGHKNGIRSRISSSRIHSSPENKILSSVLHEVYAPRPPVRVADERAGAGGTLQEGSSKSSTLKQHQQHSHQRQQQQIARQSTSHTSQCGYVNISSSSGAISSGTFQLLREQQGKESIVVDSVGQSQCLPVSSAILEGRGEGLRQDSESGQTPIRTKRCLATQAASAITVLTAPALPATRLAARSQSTAGARPSSPGSRGSTAAGVLPSCSGSIGNSTTSNVAVDDSDSDLLYDLDAAMGQLTMAAQELEAAAQMARSTDGSSVEGSSISGMRSLSRCCTSSSSSGTCSNRQRRLGSSISSSSRRYDSSGGGSSLGGGSGNVWGSGWELGGSIRSGSSSGSAGFSRSSSLAGRGTAAGGHSPPAPARSRLSSVGAARPSPAGAAVMNQQRSSGGQQERQSSVQGSSSLAVSGNDRGGDNAAKEHVVTIQVHQEELQHFLAEREEDDEPQQGLKGLGSSSIGTSSEQQEQGWEVGASRKAEQAALGPSLYELWQLHFGRWQEQQQVEKMQKKAERKRRLTSWFSLLRFGRTAAQNRVLPAQPSLEVGAPRSAK